MFQVKFSARQRIHMKNQALFSSKDMHSSFGLACEAEARHMYCFSGSGVVVVRGGVNFFVFRSFSRKL